MNVGVVLLVAAKELRETLRDRRTLVVMVLFPLVVYPLVSLLMAQVMAGHTARGEARRSRVAVEGPAAEVAAVRARLGADAKAFEIVTLASLGGGFRDGRAAVEAGALDAALELGPATGSAGGARVRVLWDEARDESRQAHDRLGATLAGQLRPGCGPLYTLEDHSIAQRARVGGYVLSKLLPLVVVVMIMLGAFYPAIDITAGERERGTLETILSSPVSRFDLMTGKVLAVATLSSITGLLNMASMSLTMIQGIRLVGATTPVAVPWTNAASTLIVVIPAAFLFASVMVAIGAMARSFKEAQTLLTPVYFLCFTPSLVAGLGDWDLAGVTAVVPGVNVTLLARDLILGKAELGVTLLVVASTLGFGALALSLAAQLYDSERLLSSDDGAPGLGAWIGRLTGLGGRTRPQEPPPLEGERPPGSAGQALVLLAVAFLLMFVLFIPLQRWRLVPGLLLSQWGGILGLVVVYARGTGRRLVDVLRLRPVPGRALAGAALIGGSAWIVVGTLNDWLLPKPPPEITEALRHVISPFPGAAGLMLALLLAALTPAICEEALFRGPILRGFASTLSPRTAAVVTGLCFGLYHLNPYQLAPASVLGVTLSLIALETGSILPAMVTHFINNACITLLAHAGLDDTGDLLSRPAQAGVFLGGLAIFLAGVALLRNRTAKAPTL